MLFYRNDCNGCADGCHGCGRNRDYPVRCCDNCGVEYDNYTTIYHYKDSDFCKECLMEELFNDALAKGAIYEVDDEEDE